MGKKIRLPKINSPFRAGLFFLIIKTFLDYSQLLQFPEIMSYIFTIISAVAFVVSILRMKYSVKVLCIYALIAGLVLVVSYRVGNYALITTTLAILAIRDQDFDASINFIFRYEVLFFLVHILFAFGAMIGGMPGYMVITGVTRYHLGFSHPNSFAIIVYNLLCMWVWLNFEDIRKRSIVGIVIIGAIVYSLTKTRTLLMELTVLIILVLAFRRKEQSRILKIGTRMTFPILSLGMYYAISHYTFNNLVIMFIDTLITGRIKLGAYAYNLRGITFLGQNLSDFKATYDSYWQMTSKFTFDNLYSCLIVNYGIVFVIILSIVFWRISKAEKPKVCIFIIIWALYGITEGHGLYCCVFFPILLVSKAFPKMKNRLGDV